MKEETDRNQNSAAKRILVVDDESAVRILLKVFLESETYDVRVAKDGKSVCEVLEKFQPDLTIADIMMPEESGFSIVSTIRDRLPFMKAIYLSAWLDETETEKKLKEELERYPHYRVLKKPFDLDDLRETIEKSLL